MSGLTHNRHKVEEQQFSSFHAREAAHNAESRPHVTIYGRGCDSTGDGGLVRGASPPPPQRSPALTGAAAAACPEATQLPGTAATARDRKLSAPPGVRRVRSSPSTGADGNMQTHSQPSGRGILGTQPRQHTKEDSVSECVSRWRGLGRFVTALASISACRGAIWGLSKDAASSPVRVGPLSLGNSPGIDLTSTGLDRISAALHGKANAAPSARAPAACAPAPPEIVFSNLVYAKIPGESPKTVEVAGSWSKFQQRHAMSRTSNGDYEIMLRLSPGEHEIKFVINGETWRCHPNLQTRQDPHNNLNNIIVVDKVMHPSPIGPWRWSGPKNRLASARGPAQAPPGGLRASAAPLVVYPGDKGSPRGESGQGTQAQRSPDKVLKNHGGALKALRCNLRRLLASPVTALKRITDHTGLGVADGGVKRNSKGQGQTRAQRGLDRDRGKDRPNQVVVHEEEHAGAQEKRGGGGRVVSFSMLLRLVIGFFIIIRSISKLGHLFII